MFDHNKNVEYYVSELSTLALKIPKSITHTAYLVGVANGTAFTLEEYLKILSVGCHKIPMTEMERMYNHLSTGGLIQ